MLYTEVGFGIFWFILLNTLYYQWVVAKILSITGALFWLVEFVAKKRGYYSRFSIGWGKKGCTYKKGKMGFLYCSPYSNLPYPNVYF